MIAEPLPPPLKIPEVSRFINRANQLRTIKPAIAYWCEYHAVNQIVTKSLHTSDDDCFAFTKSLIERLEATKTERADDDAVVDNTAGQAYVEQFAQETFARAERAMRANKVTRQTADTFDAAATFFDLTREWGTPDPEVVKKIKFAKWNAARILRAIREGRDPNESNPILEDLQPEQLLSPSDPAVRAITQSGAPLPVSVEDAEDAGEPSVPDAQGGYVPSVSESFESLPAPPLLSESPVPGVPIPSPPLPPPEVPLPSSVPSPLASPASPGPFVPVTSPGQSSTNTGRPAWKTRPAPRPAALPTGPPSAPAAPTPNPKSIEQAQKHAKWAISALNFEDIPTAVQELRNALALLGCQ